MAPSRQWASTVLQCRKDTGTPDNIVEYIVANTVGPILEEKLEALRSEFRKVRKTFDNELQEAQAYPPAEVRGGKMDHRQWAGLQTYNHHKELVERMFDLKTLDPAMGSGHFLVEAVDFVTDRLLNFLNQFPINPVSFALDRTRTSILESLGEQGVTVDPAKLTDINLLKRHVLKRCIYGVDINPMAVELAKVTNACKHSKSKKVTVTMTQEEQNVRLEVQDWGIGFDPDSVEEGHFGLEGIRQRVRLLGGRLTIESKAGSGTLVQVVVPIVEKQGET